MRPPIAQMPFVTLVIPCRNEADFIATCLDSVVALDWPKGLTEVLVCDGMSTDGTVEIVRRFAVDHPHIHLLQNPGRTLASGWNLGLGHARGDVVGMMIAHQTYESDYVSTSVRYLREFDADGVGGSMSTMPQDDTAIGRAIGAAWGHPFGVGNAYFRIGTDKPRWVDNIHCGVFRRDALERVAGYDERLSRSQDADMQTRLRAAGGRLLLVPESFSVYYTRSRFDLFAKYAVINGYWVAKPLEHGAFLDSMRHWVPLIFVSVLFGLSALALMFEIARLVLVGVATLYLVCAAGAAAQVAVRRRDLRYMFLLPVVFATLHVGYGIGTALGLVELGRKSVTRLLRNVVLVGRS